MIDHTLRTGASRLVLAAILTVAAAPATVLAQTTPDTAPVAGPSGAAVETVVVRGARLSRQRAIDAKRTADTIVEVVSADNIGALPDFNTAEAIQRLPGISTQIDQGEARYAVVRGVDSNLNLVLIDGNLVGAPEAEGRRVSLDTIPSDLVRNIEVVKSSTPDLDGSAVGGQINIITPTAFDRPDRQVNYSVRGNWSKKAEELGGGGSVLWSKRFGEETFGLALGASYNTRTFRSDLWEAIEWAPQGTGGTFGPGSVRYFDYDIMRERIGLIANADFRPREGVSVFIKSVFNEYTDVEGRQQAEFDHNRGVLTETTPGVLSYSRGEVFREFRQNEQTQRIYNLSAGFEVTRGKAEVSGRVTFGRGEEVTPIRNDIEYRAQDVALTPLPSTLDVRGERATFTAIGSRFFDPAAFRPRRYFFRQEDITEDLGAVQLDARLNDALGPDVALQFGVKHVAREKLRDNRRQRFDSIAPATVTWATIGGVIPQPGPWFDGKAEFGPYMDYDVLLGFFRANPTLFTLNTQVEIDNQFNLDYAIDEKISAIYGMADLTRGDFRLIGGVRIEHTDVKTSAFQVEDTDNDGVLEASDVLGVQGAKSFTDVLPSLNMTWDVGEATKVRAAAGVTIGRPDYDDMVPTFDIDGTTGTEAVAGNSALEPYRSVAFDLSIEHYPDAETIFSIGLFHKRIENPIFTRTTLNTVFNNVPVTRLDRPENAQTGTLLGVEFNAIQRFSKLPAPFDGLGVSVNGTFVDSKVKVPGRLDELPFFRQSRWIANGALFYEKGPLEMRLAVSYRDAYLETVGPTPDDDVYFGDRAQIDFKTSWTLPNEMELFVSVSNLNDASRVEYQGVPSRRLAEEIYDYSISFGISGKF